MSIFTCDICRKPFEEDDLSQCAYCFELICNECQVDGDIYDPDIGLEVTCCKECYEFQYNDFEENFINI